MRAHAPAPHYWGINMKRSRARRIGALLAAAGVLGGIGLAWAQQEQRGATSYPPLAVKGTTSATVAKSGTTMEFSDNRDLRQDGSAIVLSRAGVWVNTVWIDRIVGTDGISHAATPSDDRRIIRQKEPAIL